MVDCLGTRRLSVTLRSLKRFLRGNCDGDATRRECLLSTLFRLVRDSALSRAVKVAESTTGIPTAVLSRNDAITIILHLEFQGTGSERLAQQQRHGTCRLSRKAMGNDELLTDEFVAGRLTQEANDCSLKYSALGMQGYTQTKKYAPYLPEAEHIHVNDIGRQTCSNPTRDSCDTSSRAPIRTTRLSSPRKPLNPRRA